MTHETFAEKLLDLAYGELSPREAGKVEAHAASCEVCRAELARIRETRSLMAVLPEEPAPERGQGILLAAARQEAERRTAKRRLPPWLLRTSLVVASLVAVAAVSYRIVSMRPGPLSAKGEREALAGDSYVRAPEAPPPARKEAPRAEREAPSLASSRAAPSAAAPAPPEAKGSAAAREDARARAFAEPPPALAAAPSAGAAPPPPAVAAAPRRSEATPAPAPAAPERGAADRGALHEELATAPARPSSSSASEAAEPLRRPVEREGVAVRRSASAKKAAPAPAEAPGVGAGLLGAQAMAQPREETRRFDGCEGEVVRRVAVDAEGRVLRYVREGRFGGRHLRILHAYGPDGALSSATALDLDRGEQVDPRALGIAPVERAEDATLDAPPRCGR